MSAPEAWVKHEDCDGTGVLYADPAPPLFPCPDCADGLVPSDGEIVAVATQMQICVETDCGWSTRAKHFLVAARRYQRKAEEQ